MNWILVFIGGGAGSLLRYLIHLNLPAATFPWATLISNILASLLLGIVVYSTSGIAWKILLAVGVCGGLSTFSTFSLETVKLAQQGQWGIVMLNIFLNVAVCTLGIYILSKKLG